MSKSYVGHLVQVRFQGAGPVIAWGIAEYLTPDGYFGVRQVGGGFAGCNRLDEFPAAWCEPDPT